MKYNEAIAAINTERALRLLDIALRINGNYIYFPCVECGKESAIRYYGMKKNVAYCPTCKKGINIIALAAKIRNMEFQDAKKFLIEKASGCSSTSAEISNGAILWQAKISIRSFARKWGLENGKAKGLWPGMWPLPFIMNMGLRSPITAFTFPTRRPSFRQTSIPNCTFTIITTLTTTRKSGLRKICLTA